GCHQGDLAATRYAYAYDATPPLVDESPGALLGRVWARAAIASIRLAGPDRRVLGNPARGPGRSVHGRRRAIMLRLLVPAAAPECGRGLTRCRFPPIGRVGYLACAQLAPVEEFLLEIYGSCF